MKKKKERRNTSFRRRVKHREPYDVILIVCEGSKTEPDYFKAAILGKSIYFEIPSV